MLGMTHYQVKPYQCVSGGNVGEFEVLDGPLLELLVRVPRLVVRLKDLGRRGR